METIKLLEDNTGKRIYLFDLMVSKNLFQDLISRKQTVITTKEKFNKFYLITFNSSLLKITMKRMKDNPQNGKRRLQYIIQ